MALSGKELKILGIAAISVVTLAATVVMGLAILEGFKRTGLVDNTTTDLFITGLGIFGTFMGILVIAVVGKVVIGLFKAAD